MIIDKRDRVSDDGTHICPSHGEYRSWGLTTGTYTFCDPCADARIKERMTELRTELSAKGYEQCQKKESA
jgi:hypothetical protein